MADLTKELHTQCMTLQMGPSHPAMHGTVKLLVDVDGEEIHIVKPEVGYLHRGFEKMCENSTYHQVTPFTDRLNYVSPFINNVGYALAVEKLLGIDVPERCKYLRVLACEISRITDHLTCLGASGMELAAFTVLLYSIEAREWMWELVEALCGARLTTTWTRIGGVAYDMPEGFEQKTHQELDKVKRLIDDISGLLVKNRIFYDRMRDTGVLTADECLAYGVTGPCLRAAGVYYDVRKAKPYLVYDRMDFEVPLGKHGDNYDKFMVRVIEMQQSIRIIEQVLDQIPDGPISVDDPKITLPPKEKVYTSIEALVHHFNIIIKGIRPPKGEVYVAVEGGNGELGFYVVSDGSDKPWKCRCRGPCFPIVQAIPKMLEGSMIADVIPTFGMVNMIGGEMDR
ncbi:MAG: NADH-quinone oxidoreductase subunit D [Candidatus Abyssobacteria bacterium SURF_17]|jgi:NADH-quinone oxidoreductase subunit D|uniref:NADH-quinone oxidoreductase subunit D n=1 Tax=Candidatus Abyssobacteria bacterium SURF_17 TaxID=2093361 RepID=A0A419EW56_9BACT|nr:MAG: NADH-quinone oxidoreductase subunit D [Candidatus Abyssubacteria bacterium SURF_17]